MADYDDVLGSRAPQGGHTSGSKADPAYEHWCRPEPKKEFPYKTAEVDAYKEGKKGMQDDTPGLKRASNGGVIGSQRGAIVPKDSPHFQDTSWGEYHDINQFDKEQEHTYDGERNAPFDD